MPDRRVGQSEFESVLESWRSTFQRLADDAARARDLLDEELDAADADEDFESAQARVSGVRRAGKQTLREIDELIRRIGELRAEWRAARRYEPEVLDRRVQDLAARVADRPASGAEEWLDELFDALDALEWPAVERLAAAEIDWPPELAPGAARIADGLARWNTGSHQAGRELLRELATPRLGGWQSVLRPRLRSRAHRLAAWVSLRRLRDPESAREHLTQAVDLFPHAGRMHAERAAYYLSIGDLDLAATDAQHAVELATDDAAGYVELGMWAELNGDFDDADGLYRKALRLLPAYDVARMHTRAALMDPPGRLLIAAADRLLEANRPDDALEVARGAVNADLRGRELHPQAAAYRLESLAMERSEEHDSSEAAAAAATAGKLFLWNGDLGTAIDQFERALELDGDADNVGWLLADAKLALSLPLGSRLPDERVLDDARRQWERWEAKVGPPTADTSWAYLTRAVIADLATQATGSDRLAGVWEALLFVEKAIAHDDVDAQRWGYAAQYLRYAGCRALAFEAAERGFKLGAGDRQVLVERLQLLTDQGRLAEAEEVGEQLVSMFGNDPWVSAARAWLALRSKRETRYREALDLLEMPLEAGNDPSWYYELRALCHTALGDLDAAREDMRRLAVEAPPIDGTTKCRRAAAAIALGETANAALWLEEASADPTSRPVTCQAVAAFKRFAEDEPEEAAALLADAAGHAESVADLDDLLDLTRSRLRLLPPDAGRAAARELVLGELERGAVRERVAWLREHPPDPDAELADRLERHGGDELIRTALLAVRARRLRRSGDAFGAEQTYKQLVGSRFEPEATAALRNATWALAKQSAAKGEASAVRRLFDELDQLGGVREAQTAIGVAAALERRRDYAEARTELEGALAAVSDPGDAQELHQRAGGLALSDGDVETAARHFEQALETARATGDVVRVGQSEIRLALLRTLQGDQPGAASHLVAAADAWREAGTTNPVPALVGELRGLTARPRGEPWRKAADETLSLVELVASPRGADDPGAAGLEGLRSALRPS